MAYDLRYTHICQDNICAQRFAWGANSLENGSMSTEYSHIGQVVRDFRKRKKLTLQQLADSIPEYDAGNLSRFERGVQGISENKLKEIAATLNTTISSIYAELDMSSKREGQTISDAQSLIPDTPTPTNAKEFDEKYRDFFYSLSEKEQAKLLGRWEAELEEALKNK